MSNTTPRTYIACLASYNAGILHGDWIDLDGTEDPATRINEILAGSPEEDAEEWAVHDHEGCGALSEYPGLDAINAIELAFVKCTTEHGVEWDAFVAYCDHLGYPLSADHISDYEDAYAGSGTSIEEWCQGFLEDTGQLESIPENLRHYFNVAAFARDMECSDVFTIGHDHETLVFWHR